MFMITLHMEESLHKSTGCWLDPAQTQLHGEIDGSHGHYFRLAKAAWSGIPNRS